MLSRFTILVVLLAIATYAGERDALAIDANLRARHMPFGTILDPIFTSATSDQIKGYTRCGDSALWTGAYLAAESFRYKATASAEALQNVKAALAGLQALSAVTGDNRLARCMVPTNSAFAAGIASEEAANNVHTAPDWIWVDNTSRDQIVGAFFGLGVAYDLVDDSAVRSGVSTLATSLLGFVSRHQWSPNDYLSSTFELRPEELQMLVQVTRHVNPSSTVSGPFLVLPVGTVVAFDTLSNSSYFKFSLDYMSFFHLLPLQNTSDNRSAYQTVRTYTASHQNAFFNMVDRSLNGPNSTRDTETAALLDLWLQRPRRDVSVDLSKSVPVCGSDACTPIPVPLRVPTDFLWQRSPYQLSGGGSGLIEGAGIDYLLPYWMARYYGVITENTVQPAAAPGSAVSPGSLASWFGDGLATSTATLTQQPPPLTLGGVTVSVTDSTGTTRAAALTYVSPKQINFVVPDGTATGTATFKTSSGQAATATIATVAPALFSMNGAGSGVAAATAIVTQAANPAVQTPVAVFQCSAAGCSAVPLALGVDTPVYVTFYGTGIRYRSSLQAVTVSINGTLIPVLYAGPSPEFAGLDQVNIGLPLSLRGAGETKVTLTVDGYTSNVVTISIR